MRDSGRDRDPAGCEVSRGCPAGKRAHLGSPSAKKLLTEEPSCEAEDMTAPTTRATPKIALAQRAASRHDTAVALTGVTTLTILPLTEIVRLRQEGARFIAGRRVRGMGGIQ